MVLRLHVVGASLILRLSTEERGGGGREKKKMTEGRKGEQRLLKSDLYTCSLEQWDNDCMH